MGETQVLSLGQEDPLEKEMAAHSSTLAWKIPWTEEHGRLQSMGSQRVGRDSATSHFTVLPGHKEPEQTPHFPGECGRPWSFSMYSGGPCKGSGG